jgi:hypothetical protein
MPEYFNVIRYEGEGEVPFDIRKRRKQSQETMRRMGTPVLIKHMYNIDDVAKGIATESVNWDTIYGQSTHDDPSSHGPGFVSVETKEGEWLDEEGNLHIAETPEAGWVPAPKYRGYGPGYLTYCILPDVPEDIWKTTAQGALLHTQQARVLLPWYPPCGDNDLLIVVEINGQQEIVNTLERYQLKQVKPTSLRGLNRLGQREFNMDAAGNRFWVQQECEANKVLETDPIYEVEADR